MPRFDPLNEKLKKQYEDVLLHGRHREPRTVFAVWKAINQFENYTGRQPFTKIHADQAKGFKQALAKQLNEKGQPLSLATIRSTLANVREFFLWLRLHPTVGRKIDARVAEYFHLSSNEDRAARASKPRLAPTVDQMRQAIEAMPHATALEKRDRALMAFAAMTAIRDGALASLRLGDVDVEARTVWQDPKHVKTKFGKGILTAWVPIEPLFTTIVVEWVQYARTELGLGNDAPMFPATRVEQNPETLTFEVLGVGCKSWSTAASIRKIFKDAFARAGLSYFNPHTCRHMLAAWAMENGGQLEFKALSQNLGHEHAMTTYNAYGYIQPEKQIKLVQGMGQRDANLRGVSDAELWEEMARRNRVK